MKRISLSLLLFFGACGDDDLPPDARTDVGMCSADSDCVDETFCNGLESCDPTSPSADGNGCVPGLPPCTGVCVEADDRCEMTDCADADGDGARDSDCGGTDCDDADPERFPGNAEVCDVENHDEDCDPSTFGFRDLDGDGYPDAACCNGDSCGTDCGDAQPGVHPGEAESCDALDNDCDGMVDEDVMRTFWRDEDNDTFGNAMEAPVMACSPPGGFVENDTDCDDTDRLINPAAGEICDAGCMADGTGCEDENCDGVVETDCECSAGEMRPCDEAGLCASGVEVCDAGTGTWGACSITPVTETCNGIDDDCNGVVDDAADAVRMRCWRDVDGDSFAVSGASTTFACFSCPAGFTDREPVGTGIDCNDNPAMNGANIAPGRPEICDGFDNDCSTGGGGAFDEDRDGDGHTNEGYAGCSGGPFPRNDCDDTEATVFGGQTEYFAAPICPPETGSPFCLGACANGNCAPASCRGGSCCCSVPKTYDRDCDGVARAEPNASGCAPTACGVAPCPSRRGPRYTGTPACGSMTTVVSCGCGGSACGFRTLPSPEPLGCR